YAQTWERYRKLTGNLELLRQEEIRFAQERDYHQFLFDELQSAALQEGESEELGHELARMRHAESLQQALFFSVNALVEADGNIDQQLRDVIHRLNEAGKHLPDAGELAGRLESLRIEARDASDELVRLRDMAWPDPSLLAGYEERLDLIYRLLRKHGAADEHALLELMENLGRLLAEGSDRQQEMRLLEKELKQTEELLLLQADGLHKGREAHQAELSAHLLSIIQRLGMPEASFEIKLEALDHPGPQGTERARFLFNANRGGKAAELSHVASGGERSRLMLAIKSCITQRNVLPTIIFDEIDTGVSGEMAQKTGQIMAEMGQRLQVIAITHLPQIAARGEKHYLVFKETDEQSTYTRVHALQSEDRTLEIARMLSGDRPSDAALQTARELMVGSRTTK
ncbi:MAG TPA: DNA repair protein RecN, partial [Bacteroidales bacterium]|nr:DNA repair protein RecN [Bacteroidales bacterium]